MTANLSTNLSDVHKKIENAALRVGRDPSSVTLVCVSKTIDTDTITEAKNLGESIFGENRPQELRDKYPVIEGATWHLIGHLQTNKVKYVVGKAALIHSVESIHLAKAINEEAKKRNIIQDILLEVNISGEESKYGLTTAQIPTIIKEISTLSNIRFRGFMTMAPLGAPEDEIRSIFRKAKELFDSYRNDGACELSMGMSGDFEIAIEEGATLVRVGSAIFKR